jgi:hypothetical protein
LLPGFEDITHELTDDERALLPKFIRGFRNKFGPDNAVTNKQIIAGFKASGTKISDARVRKIINYIRTHDIVPGLVATSKGYYVTRDPMTIKKYIQSLDARIREIQRVRDAMARDLKTNFSQIQSSLWERKL